MQHSVVTCSSQHDVCTTAYHLVQKLLVLGGAGVFINTLANPRNPPFHIFVGRFLDSVGGSEGPIWVQINYQATVEIPKSF